MAEYAAHYRNTGRERKSHARDGDAQLMLLTLLNYGQQWDFIPRLYGMDHNTFERQVVAFQMSLWSILTHYVHSVQKKTRKCSSASKIKRFIAAWTALATPQM